MSLTHRLVVFKCLPPPPTHHPLGLEMMTVDTHRVLTIKSDEIVRGKVTSLTVAFETGQVLVVGPLCMARCQVHILEACHAEDAREFGPHVLQHDVDSDAGFGRDKVTVTLAAFVHQLPINFLSCLDFGLSLSLCLTIEIFKMDSAMVFELLIIFKIFVAVSTTKAANQRLIIVMITFDMLKYVFYILTFVATIFTIKLWAKVHS